MLSESFQTGVILNCIDYIIFLTVCQRKMCKIILLRGIHGAAVLDKRLRACYNENIIIYSQLIQENGSMKRFGSHAILACLAAVLTLAILSSALTSCFRIQKIDHGTETTAPETQPPETEKPAVTQPATDKPTTDKPTADKPGTDKPATDNPGTGDPVTDLPEGDKPGTEQPAQPEPENEPEIQPAAADFTLEDLSAQNGLANLLSWHQTVTVRRTFPWDQVITYTYWMRDGERAEYTLSESTMNGEADVSSSGTYRGFPFGETAQHAISAMPPEGVTMIETQDARYQEICVTEYLPTELTKEIEIVSSDDETVTAVLCGPVNVGEAQGIPGEFRAVIKRGTLDILSYVMTCVAYGREETFTGEITYDGERPYESALTVWDKTREITLDIRSGEGNRKQTVVCPAAWEIRVDPYYFDEYGFGLRDPSMYITSPGIWPDTDGSLRIPAGEEPVTVTVRGNGYLPPFPEEFYGSWISSYGNTLTLAKTADGKCAFTLAEGDTTYEGTLGVFEYFPNDADTVWRLLTADGEPVPDNLCITCEATAIRLRADIGQEFFSRADETAQGPGTESTPAPLEDYVGRWISEGSVLQIFDDASFIYDSGGYLWTGFLRWTTEDRSLWATGGRYELVETNGAVLFDDAHVIAENNGLAFCVGGGAELFTKGSAIRAEYAGDTLPDHNEFTADRGEYAVKVLLTPNVPVKNFSFFSLTYEGMNETEPIFSSVEPYRFADMKPEKPLLVTMTFGEAFPSYGFSYQDENGLHQYGITQSGMDGSVILTEITVGMG